MNRVAAIPQAHRHWPQFSLDSCTVQVGCGRRRTMSRSTLGAGLQFSLRVGCTTDESPRLTTSTQPEPMSTDPRPCLSASRAVLCFVSSCFRRRPTKAATRCSVDLRLSRRVPQLLFQFRSSLQARHSSDARVGFPSITGVVKLGDAINPKKLGVDFTPKTVELEPSGYVVQNKPSSPLGESIYRAKSLMAFSC